MRVSERKKDESKQTETFCRPSELEWEDLMNECPLLDRKLQPKLISEFIFIHQQGRVASCQLDGKSVSFTPDLLLHHFMQLKPHALTPGCALPQL